MNAIEVEKGNVVFGQDNETTFLTIFTLTCSSVGIALSAAALALLFLTAILFAEWRQSYKNQLLIQFMTARFFYTFVRYFYDVKSVFSTCVGSNCVIHLNALSLIYTETTLVSWMFVFSKQMYDSFVKVFVVEEPNIFKVSLLTWTVPGVASLFFHLLFYIQNNYDLKFFLIYIVVVKWPVLIGNAVFLSLVLKSILKSNKSKNTESNPRIILVMIVLIFTFCFQQVLLDSYKVIYLVVLHKYTLSSYLLLVNNIISLYHCAFAIIFWVFGNKNTRSMWKYRCTGFRSKRQLEATFSRR